MKDFIRADGFNIPTFCIEGPHLSLKKNPEAGSFTIFCAQEFSVLHK